MRIVQIFATASLLLIAGCASDGTKTGANAAPGAASSTAPGAIATLRDAAGITKGSATLTDDAGGLHLMASISGLAPGAYGIHLHMTGKCEGPDFKTAGAHWNPTMKMHGMENPAGHHLGDLPNLVIGADGQGTLDATIPGAMLSGGATPLLDADGAALVIHAAADDYKTDPSGNSGARVACGMIAAG